MQSPLLAPFLAGFFLGGSLIVAIGPQNAYILRMGLLRHHIFWLCLFCSVSDAVLIILGVAGVGAIVEAHPQLLRFVAGGGAIFLFAYSLIALRRVFQPGILKIESNKKQSLAKAIAICGSLTWLNPHVYLDTVVLVGAYSTQYSDGGRLVFGFGAVLSSFAWFFALGYAARLLEPLFAKEFSWQVFDSLIAIVMGSLSFALFKTALG